MGARSTYHAPSPNSGASCVASWIASRVLPTPPAPVSVTSRWFVSRLAISTDSVSRPMKLVS